MTPEQALQNIGLLPNVIIMWLMWEIVFLFVSKPADPETGKMIRPPMSVGEWYLQRQVMK